jgi:hypothetical protein
MGLQRRRCRCKTTALLPCCSDVCTLVSSSSSSHMQRTLARKSSVYRHRPPSISASSGSLCVDRNAAAWAGAGRRGAGGAPSATVSEVTSAGQEM